MRQLSRVEAQKFVRKWECLGFFPKTGEGMEALAEALIAIAGDTEKASWLSTQVVMGCPRCPTPLELRRIFERKYKPADGIESRSLDVSDLMSNGGTSGAGK